VSLFDNSRVALTCMPGAQNFGFLGLKKDPKIKLLPEGFSADSLPRSCSSLFSIANRRGLFAAAGPKSKALVLSRRARDTNGSRFRHRIDSISTRSVHEGWRRLHTTAYHALTHQHIAYRI